MGKGDNRRPTDKAAAVSCHDVGHTMADKWGNCWRCGAPIGAAKPRVFTPDEIINGPDDYPYSTREDMNEFHRVAEQPTTEAESLALYHELIERGLSDYEARGTAWPEPAGTS